METADRIQAPQGVLRSVFQQEWWLDTVTGGDFGEVTVRSDNSVVGWLPFVKRKRWGYLISGMPFLTHTLGPLIEAQTGNAANELLRSTSITRELLEKLPKFAHFRQVLPPSSTNTLGFVEFGCHARVQFTFIADCANLEHAWKNMRDKTRNLIRRAEERCVVQELTEVGAFLRLYDDNCRERGVANRYADSRTERILSQSLAREQGMIYVSSDRATGKANAAIVVVWDSGSMYFLMSTRQQTAHSGAVSLLLWHAMQRAHRLGVNFDFDGATSRGTYKFLSGFGGVLANRHVVERFDPVYHALDKIRASFYPSGEDQYAS